MEPATLSRSLGAKRAPYLSLKGAPQTTVITFLFSQNGTNTLPSKMDSVEYLWFPQQ